MKSLFQLVLASALASAAPAAVTLTFDTDAQGFGSVGWNANGSTAWSASNGGSVALNTTIGGWSNPVGVISMTSPALASEYAAALANGGTISFDYIVSQADITGYNVSSPPGWFELVAFGNTDSGVGGGYDQNVLGGAAGYYGGIPTGPTIKNVTIGVAAGPPVNDNNIASFGLGSGWNEFMLGFNSQSASYTGATVFIDNFTLTANPVPEVSTSALALLAGAALLGRRSA